MMRRVHILILLAVLIQAAGAGAGDWPAFRGPNGDGLADDSRIPHKWSETENIRWRINLPGEANSSPIVSNGVVFVTAARDQGKVRVLAAYDRQSGKELWQKEVAYDKPDPTHNTNPYSGSTPAATSDLVVVWHGSAGLYCYDFKGEELWKRDLGEHKHIWGYGASPVIRDNIVYLNCGPGPNTLLVALKLSNGETIWEHKIGGDSGEEIEGKPVKWVGSWSTPVVREIDGKIQVLMSWPGRVQAYDAVSGKETFHVEGLGDLVYTSPLISNEGVGVAMGGYNGPALGFLLGGNGNTTQNNRLWWTESNTSKKTNPQRIGSGVVVGEHIYQADANPPSVECMELRTGKRLWQTRINGGEIWGSVVHNDGHLIICNPDGETHILKVSPSEAVTVAVNKLDGHTNSTPAISEGEIFYRTYESLYCIGEKNCCFFPSEEGK